MSKSISTASLLKTSLTPTLRPTTARATTASSLSPFPYRSSSSSLVNTIIPTLSPHPHRRLCTRTSTSTKNRNTLFTRNSREIESFKHNSSFSSFTSSTFSFSASRSSSNNKTRNESTDTVKASSEESSRTKEIITQHDFTSINSLVSSSSSSSSPSTTATTPTYLLLDVREPHEYNSGHIPTALNLPIVSRPDAFSLSPEDFENAFGFCLPPKKTSLYNSPESSSSASQADTTTTTTTPTNQPHLIFYCKAGIRSAAAARLCREAGWEDVGEYPGSWNDWVNQEGAIKLKHG